MQKNIQIALLSFPLFFFAISTFAQTKVEWENKGGEDDQVWDLPSANFIDPVNIPLKLTGNFGELRRNHFHTGLDIATEGQIGLEIQSIESGYVSRIKIGPWGYGKALYITHPNGLTSVYGHLDEFHGAIAEWARNRQYSWESFEIDVELQAGELSVEQGDLIALSGNTGGSGGPHLHFEIRDGDIPINPLHYGYDIADSRKPQISQLYVYEKAGASTEQFRLYQQGSKFSPKQNIKVEASKVGLGISGYDRQNSRENKNGIYSLKLLVNGRLHYQFKMDSLPFAEKRYYKAHVDYAKQVEAGKLIHRLYRLPGNQHSITSQQNGWIDIKSGDTLDILVLAEDWNGNKSEASFNLIGTEKAEQENLTASQIAYWERSNYFEQNGFYIDIPQGALFEDLAIAHEVEFDQKWSATHKLNPSPVPFFSEVKMGVQAVDLPEKYYEKALVVLTNARGRKSVLGGKYIEGYVHCKTDQLGSFHIALDTVAPTIRYIGALQFKIDDNFSGIAGYRAELDGEWLLMEYEPKRELLFYRAHGKIEPGAHELVVKVWDERGNLAEKSIRFTE
jgi:hypothetical protein